MKTIKYHFRVVISLSNGHSRTVFVQRPADAENIARIMAKQAGSALFEAKFHAQTSFARNVLRNKHLIIDRDYNYNFFFKGEHVLLFNT